MDNMVMLGGAVAVGGLMMLLISWGMGDKEEDEDGEDGEEDKKE